MVSTTKSQSGNGWFWGTPICGNLHMTILSRVFFFFLGNPTIPTSNGLVQRERAWITCSYPEWKKTLPEKNNCTEQNVSPLAYPLALQSVVVRKNTWNDNFSQDDPPFDCCSWHFSWVQTSLVKTQKTRNGRSSPQTSHVRTHNDYQTWLVSQKRQRPKHADCTLM